MGNIERHNRNHPNAWILSDSWLTIMVVAATPEDERDLGVEGGGYRS